MEFIRKRRASHLKRLVGTVEKLDAAGVHRKEEKGGWMLAGFRVCFFA
jgi:hypothetical protein